MSKGLESITRISELDLQSKKVFLRLDLNVPLDGDRIVDDLRIQAAIPTIKYALSQDCKLIICSHLGRPKEKGDPSCSLLPVAQKLGEILGVEVLLVDDPESEAAIGLLPSLSKRKIMLLENIRYAKGEKSNDENFAEHLASYTDIYINDAFGASHRSHASIVSLAKKVPTKSVGLLMEKEIEMLDKILYSAEAPFTAVLGGSKVSDKIGLIENLMDKVDNFIIGGAMSYTFLAAKGVPIGSSRIETEKVGLARDLMERIEGRGKKILLPIDHIVVKELKEAAAFQETPTDGVQEGFMAVDIGPKTQSLYAGEIRRAKSLLWNGPMGVYEIKPFDKGSNAVARAFAQAEAVTIIGGGDSAAVVRATGLADQMTHISTGGGASLEYLQGDALPGLQALR